MLQPPEFAALLSLSHIWLQLYLEFYPYGFAAAIGTWASISLSISAGEYDWPVSQTNQIKVRDQLNSPNAWSQTTESTELTKPTAN